MKKFFMIVAAALMLGTTANAQANGTEIILRGGFATNQFIGDDFDHGYEMNPGYNMGIELNNYIMNGLYWNTGFLFGSRGFKVDQEVFEDISFRAHNIQIPLTIGYKYDLGSGIALDGRIGTFFSADIAGKEKWEMRNGTVETKIKDIDNYHRCDGGLLIGVGVWYNNINLDLAYQRGFGQYIDGVEGGASNFLIRLGYAF